MKSTKEMRDRARELATPPRDDFDRAVLYILDDFDLYASPDREAASRGAVIEECAKVVEDFYGEAADALPFLEPRERSRRIAASDIAAALRALAQQAKPQQERGA